MGNLPLIPAADPMPLPAPLWLFKVLLLVTFLLHIIVMNFFLGGGVIAIVARWRGAKDQKLTQLSRDITKKIPSLLAATITLGVAPLLFLQVLYGQLFYTSSVLMAWPWFLVVVILTIAYYGYYLVAFKDTKGSSAMGWILIGSVFLTFLIGFIYTNNLTLMLTPEKWKQIYFQDPSGWNLNLSEGMLIPRYLHFMVASLAVGAFLIVITGIYRWKKDTENARFLISYGGKWFMYSTMVQFAIGIWFLIALPKDKMMIFMGGNLLATIAMLIGIVLALAAIFIMSGALRKEDPRRGAIIAMSLIGVVLVFMAIMRDALRDAYLAPYFKLGDLAVKTQFGVLILFLVLFVGGILVWVWMMKKYFLEPQPATVKE